MARSPWFPGRWAARLLAGAVVMGAFLMPEGGSRRAAEGGAVASVNQVGPATTETRSTVADRPEPIPSPAVVEAVPAGGPNEPSAPSSPQPMPALPDGDTSSEAASRPAEPAPATTDGPEPVATSPVIEASGAEEITEVLAEVVEAGPPVVVDQQNDPATDAALVAVVRDADGGLAVERIELTSDTDLAEVARDVADAGTLVGASYDAIVTVDEPEAVSEADVVVTGSSDALRFQQWSLDHVPFETAWPISNGGGVVVAVLDTAIDLNHPDLVGQFLPAYHFLSSGSGPGVSVAPPSNFHGTHVAGIIAAIANNSIGIAGGAPGVKILPIEVLGADGTGSYSSITSGIIYAADLGADVINLSLGGSAPSAALDAAVAYAVQKGAVVMAAAGNSSCTVGVNGCATNYPAASPGATAIGSVTSTNACSSFTTRAGYVSLGAPGSSIVSTAPSNLYSSGYVTASGTSMATPNASAAAALVAGARPLASPAQVVAALRATAVDVVDPGIDSCSGAGLVDPLAAIAAVATGPGSAPNSEPLTLVAPRLAGALNGRGMVRLSFVVPPGASLIVVRRDGVVIASVAASRRSYTDRSVAPTTTYTYTVTAYSDSLGESPSSGARQITTRG